MKIFLLINVKMPTVVGILTFMSRKNGIVMVISRKNSILGVSEPEKAEYLDILILMSIKNSGLAELSMKIFLYSRDLVYTVCCDYSVQIHIFRTMMDPNKNTFCNAEGPRSCYQRFCCKIRFAVIKKLNRTL